MAKAKSTDPKKVAFALEGITVKSFNGEVTMRGKDHQMQQPVHIGIWKKATASGVGSYSIENTGYNFAPVKTYESYVASTPTSCDMQRPK